MAAGEVLTWRDQAVISIVLTPVRQRIGGLGYTMQRPIKDRFLTRWAEPKGKMAVLPGDRVSRSARL
jgi:hypothetical protein